MSEDKHSKTEKPSQKKVDEARNKSGAPRSRELSSAFSLIAAMIALSSSAGVIVSRLKREMTDIFGGLATIDVSYVGVHNLMIKEFTGLAVMLAPFLIIMIVAALAVDAGQAGVHISAEKFKLDFGKLNPIQGLSRLCNKDSFFEVAKAFAKMGIVGYMAYRIISDEMDGIIYLVDQDLPGILAFIGHLSFKLVLHTCGVLLVLAVIDLAFVKWRFMSNLKMTKQEVKDEHKNTEGDPGIKGKIRQKQMQMARRRIRQIIPTADVVVTNPTHFAVALKYDRSKAAAPFVLVKGMDAMAQQIKAIARESNVTLVENRFLARELYAQVDEGQEIPEALYAAVAEVLAYVYNLKGKR